jgi:YHS domain-containing protein
MAKDVVCGMDVDEQEAESRGLTSSYNGEMFYFCAPGCKKQFEKNPEHFIGSKNAQP